MSQHLRRARCVTCGGDVLLLDRSKEPFKIQCLALPDALAGRRPGEVADLLGKTLVFAIPIVERTGVELAAERAPSSFRCVSRGAGDWRRSP